MGEKLWPTAITVADNISEIEHTIKNAFLNILAKTLKLNSSVKRNEETIKRHSLAMPKIEPVLLVRNKVNKADVQKTMAKTSPHDFTQ